MSSCGFLATGIKLFNRQSPVHDNRVNMSDPVVTLEQNETQSDHLTTEWVSVTRLMTSSVVHSLHQQLHRRHWYPLALCFHRCYMANQVPTCLQHLQRNMTRIVLQLQNSSVFINFYINIKKEREILSPVHTGERF